MGPVNPLSLAEIIDLHKREKSKAGDIPWLNSRNLPFKTLPTPQDKGTVGVKLFMAHLLSLGYEVEIVSDQGDIKYRKPGGSWIKDEVKSASARIRALKNGDWSTTHVFNQIRPNQEGWDGVTLVSVWPNHTEIHRLSREEYFRSKSIGSAGISSGHTGTEELDKVTLVSNSRTFNYDEWSCIYTDKETK
jgi:hypothetical protein